MKQGQERRQEKKETKKKKGGARLIKRRAGRTDKHDGIKKVWETLTKRASEMKGGKRGQNMW